MTDKEVMQMALETLDNMVKVDWREWDEFASVEDFVRWAKSRASFTAETLRAALAQPEPKPVAWFTEDHREDKSATTYSKKMAERWKEKGWPVTSLYTAPPQREWHGLTDEEVDEAEKEFGVWRGRVAKQSFESGAWWANEKLLEKNT